MTSTWMLQSANMQAKIGNSAWDMGAALGSEDESWWLSTAVSASYMWLRGSGCLARDFVPSSYPCMIDPSRWLHSLSILGSTLAVIACGVTVIAVQCDHQDLDGVLAWLLCCMPLTDCKQRCTGCTHSPCTSVYMVDAGRAERNGSIVTWAWARSFNDRRRYSLAGKQTSGLGVRACLPTRPEHASKTRGEQQKRSMMGLGRCCWRPGE
jgi:hypothetical protein